MVDPNAVDEPLPDQLDDLSAQRLEDLRILHAHACEVADVEEAPALPRPPIEVEELRAQQRVAPERVRVRRGHVVRHHVEQDAEPRVAELEEGLLPAQLLRERGRVEHVVAVRRALARLERRREVEVRDPELVEVRDQLARPAEIQVRQELQPVRGAERLQRHVRRRTTTERGSMLTVSRAANDSAPSPSCGSPVASTSDQRAPNLRTGSLNSTVSCCALKRSTNVSSTIGSPVGVRVEISSPFRYTPSVWTSSRDQSRRAIRRPSGRNHHTSGRPVPRGSVPVKKAGLRKFGCALRSAI